MSSVKSKEEVVITTPDRNHGYCDECGGVERYDSFYHFSSATNKHVHVCVHCVLKDKFQSKLVDM
jgi:hypothetical protein